VSKLLLRPPRKPYMGMLLFSCHRMKVSVEVGIGFSRNRKDAGEERKRRKYRTDARRLSRPRKSV
jgi:hypothetical protein